MRKVRSFLLVSAVFFYAINVKAQNYIYVSKSGLAKFLRVNAGITQWSIQPQDSALKSARGIYLSNEVKVISAFFSHDNKFTVYDAFYFDLSFGKMINKVASNSYGKESAFSLCTNFGYLVTAGYRNEKFSALAGVDFRWSKNTVGGLNMPNLYGPLFYFYKPVVARGEYAFRKNYPAQRIALMGWYSLNTRKTEIYRSVRLEFCIEKTGNWWLFSQYVFQKGLTQDNFRFTEPADGRLNQMSFGLRKGVSP